METGLQVKAAEHIGEVLTILESMESNPNPQINGIASKLASAIKKWSKVPPANGNGTRVRIGGEYYRIALDESSDTVALRLGGPAGSVKLVYNGKEPYALASLDGVVEEKQMEIEQALNGIVKDIYLRCWDTRL